MTVSTKSSQDTRRPLPPGWRWVKLGMLIREAQAGFACGERDATGIAQLRMNNLDTRGNFVWDSVLRVPRESRDVEQFLLLPGDVLFNNTNSTELVGKSALFSGYAEPIVYSNHFTRLRTISDALLPDLLANWLNHQWQQGVFAAICNRWIGQSAVKADKLLNLEFPLPPLAEQQHIAALLNAQLAAVAQARAAAEARLAAVKALPAAFLRQVFPQPGRPLPPGWRWVKLGEVCDIITDGTHVTPRYVEEGVRFISIANLRPFAPIDWNAYIKFITPEEHAELTRRCKPERDDILVAKIGTLGVAKRIDFDEPVSIFVGLALLKLRRQLAAPEFVEAYLNSPAALEQALLGAQGGGRQTLPLQNLALFRVPLPPLPEQQRIAALLNEQLAAVAQARAAAEAELATINALPAALLRGAFNGDL